jgi:hypothetical protein
MIRDRTSGATRSTATIVRRCASSAARAAVTRWPTDRPVPTLQEHGIGDAGNVGEPSCQHWLGGERPPP